MLLLAQYLKPWIALFTEIAFFVREGHNVINYTLSGTTGHVHQLM